MYLQRVAATTVQVQRGHQNPKRRREVP
ncbi:hypothetical protein Esi_0137_0058 [Ectocarpus siliculosus]|uniref:Uncharacterized protein n=1 Tax=Ectocarpus siliculosus TaxID=2880 RepID=D8LEP8_ECTSI|nr:hypothetical protein Esi_0137_0058 [Ectocarpus siliculosus]|eukprot:CBN78611.1 hypothetical protein Esi_0137_0058 [Ectocarpus siliculosus]